LADKNLEHDMSLLAKGGRVIIVGSRGSLTFSPRLAMTKEADIRGMTIGNSTKEELARELRGLAALLRGITPVVGQEFPLADAARAQDEVIQKSASHGKMILRIATV
jgi:NADPH2:quinone reductase